MNAVVDAGAGGLVVRQLLPVVFVLPLMLAWLSWQGVRAGWYEPGFAMAVFVTLTTNLLAYAVWVGGRVLHGFDEKRLVGRSRTRAKRGPAPPRGHGRVGADDHPRRSGPHPAHEPRLVAVLGVRGRRRADDLGVDRAGAGRAGQRRVGLPPCGGRRGRHRPRRRMADHDEERRHAHLGDLDDAARQPRERTARLRHDRRGRHRAQAGRSRPAADERRTRTAHRRAHGRTHAGERRRSSDSPIRSKNRRRCSISSATASSCAISTARSCTGARARRTCTAGVPTKRSEQRVAPAAAGRLPAAAGRYREARDRQGLLGRRSGADDAHRRAALGREPMDADADRARRAAGLPRGQPRHHRAQARRGLAEGQRGAIPGAGRNGDRRHHLDRRGRDDRLLESRRRTAVRPAGVRGGRTTGDHRAPRARALGVPRLRRARPSSAARSRRSANGATGRASPSSCRCRPGRPRRARASTRPSRATSPSARTPNRRSRRRPKSSRGRTGNSSSSPTWRRTICRSRCGWCRTTRSSSRGATRTSSTATRTTSSTSPWMARSACRNSSTTCCSTRASARAARSSSSRRPMRHGRRRACRISPARSKKPARQWSSSRCRRCSATSRSSRRSSRTSSATRSSSGGRTRIRS